MAPPSDNTLTARNNNTVELYSKQIGTRHFQYKVPRLIHWNEQSNQQQHTPPIHSSNQNNNKNLIQLYDINQLVKERGIYQHTYTFVDHRECLICYDRIIHTYAAKPCGHALLCLDCLQQCHDTCPFCRIPIETVDRIFI